MAAIAPRDPLPHPFPALTRGPLETLQVNLGYRCNQACTHCHVDAGPARTEEMHADTVDLVLEFARRRRPRVLDITGGAPNSTRISGAWSPAARALGMEVIDRCNLTILEEPGQENLAGFLADHAVRVVASLPCYGVDNVDRQRGKGVFDKSVRALRRLNALGYGRPGGARVLDLVYNPGGAFLPPPQAELEATYKTRLRDDHGVEFNRLLTLANMPIARFRHALAREGRLTAYLQLLRDGFSAANLAHVMCRGLLSVSWEGFVHDCDFNQMLKLPFATRARPTHLAELLDAPLEGLPITVQEHCFGCTAGQGSSCGGALER